MSLLAATQIPKPADEQAFERASVVLWRGLLDDRSVQRNGRRGQRQNGVDLFGIRDGDADWHVGIQCKVKSEGHALSEDEVRSEVKKALTFKPPLQEYYIITTAPDDVAMQELAREIYEGACGVRQGDARVRLGMEHSGRADQRGRGGAQSIRSDPHAVR